MASNRSIDMVRLNFSSVGRRVRKKRVEKCLRWCTAKVSSVYCSSRKIKWEIVSIVASREKPSEKQHYRVRQSEEIYICAKVERGLMLKRTQVSLPLGEGRQVACVLLVIVYFIKTIFFFCLSIFNIKSFFFFVYIFHSA